MTDNLIKIIDQNIQYLKSCLDITEAHITWGTKDVKDKYTKIKNNLLNKIKEQQIDKEYYLEEIQTEKENVAYLTQYFSN